MALQLALWCTVVLSIVSYTVTSVLIDKNKNDTIIVNFTINSDKHESRTLRIGLHCLLGYAPSTAGCFPLANQSTINALSSKNEEPAIAVQRVIALRRCPPGYVKVQGKCREVDTVVTNSLKLEETNTINSLAAN